MSYKYAVLTDNPLALYMLDDTVPFQDYSPYNRSGVMVAGTVTTAAALTAGASFSSVFSNSNNAKFDSPVYVQGYEQQDFSLEISIRVIAESGTGDQKVLSTVSNTDGVSVNGTVVSFSTKYSTAGEAKISYDLGVKKNAHIVAIHNTYQNILYVNGKLVGAIDLTDAQRADTFVTTDGKLYLGASAATQKVAANGVVIYGYALSETQVQTHYQAARRTVMSPGIAVPFFGKKYPVSQTLGDKYLSHSWTTTEEYNFGVFNQTVVSNGKIVPILAAGVSVAGDWQTVVPLDMGFTSIYGVSFTWEGSGVTLQVSLDGSTWETLVKGIRPALIPAGYNPTNKDLYLKASFAGSVSNDPSYISNIRFSAFKTGASVDIDGRTVTYTSPASLMYDHEPIEMDDESGVRLTGAGVLTISADGTSLPDDMFTLNIWMKKLTTTTPTFSANVTGTTYVNGAAGSTLNQGEWVMYTVAKATAMTGSITISGDVQIGQVELYDHQLNATEVADIYKAATGVPVLSAPDASVITVSVPVTEAKLYDYSWSIVAAG